MKSKKFKLFTVAFAIPTAALLLVNSAFASSSISGSVGVSTYGSLSKAAHGASGTTTCGSTSCTVTVAVTYNYIFGSTSITRSDSASNNGTTSTSVTANASYQPEVFVSASGYHTAYYAANGQSWSGPTNI